MNGRASRPQRGRLEYGAFPSEEGGVVQAAPFGGSAEHSEAIGVASHYVTLDDTLMVRLP